MTSVLHVLIILNLHTFRVFIIENGHRHALQTEALNILSMVGDILMPLSRVVESGFTFRRFVVRF
jgi:hypothetical protein